MVVSRRTLGYALLFGLPPGVGVAGYVAAAQGGPMTPFALVAGGIAALVVGGLVAIAAETGSADERRDVEGRHGGNGNE